MASDNSEKYHRDSSAGAREVFDEVRQVLQERLGLTGRTDGLMDKLLCPKDVRTDGRISLDGRMDGWMDSWK